MSEAMRLANALQQQAVWEGHYGPSYLRDLLPEAAAELRRLVAENEALKVELHEQACINGMGGEREARLMAELERKSDAIQRLWKERDELRSECRVLVRQNGEWQALHAELVEALRSLSDEVERFGLHHPDGNSNWWPVTLEKARAAIAKIGERNV